HPPPPAGLHRHDASMEPSRERDGDDRVHQSEALGRRVASMEPSRERDGDPDTTRGHDAPHDPLQWSRRANATETLHRLEPGKREVIASMEPSRERDGDVM